MLFYGRKINEDINQEIIVSSEHKKKHIARNPNHKVVYQYRVDGDLISDKKQPRCDFLLENEDDGRVYFIELKGSDLSHAVQQIDQTIKTFAQKIQGYIIFPRIVCHSNTHKMNHSTVLKFRKKYPRCIIQDKVIEEII